MPLLCVTMEDMGEFLTKALTLQPEPEGRAGAAPQRALRARYIVSAR